MSAGAFLAQIAMASTRLMSKAFSLRRILQADRTSLLQGLSPDDVELRSVAMLRS
jgi:hypothetical protein